MNRAWGRAHHLGRVLACSTAQRHTGLPVTQEPDWLWKGSRTLRLGAASLLGSLPALPSTPVGSRRGWEEVLLTCSGPGSVLAGPPRKSRAVF